VSDCCLTPNEQYEELDISKNSGKPYKNTNFDKEDILANHKSFMSYLNIPINEENCDLSSLYWIPEFQKNQYLDRYISDSSTCSTKELSITMTKICMQSKEDYCHTVTKYIHVVTSIKSTASVA
jgi:hypothetical protein